MSQLTLPTLAALTPDEFNVNIVDENTEQIENYYNGNYHAVCITAMTPTAQRAYEIANQFRENGTKVIIGGVHASLMPEEAGKFADSIVVGEAESIWKDVLYDLKNDSLKKIYKSQNMVDLSSQPTPAHELVERKKYVRIPKVETSRGCPFNCSFCSTTLLFGNRMRYRPVDEVIDEIKKIKAKFVFFTDNNIIGNPSYAKKLFKELVPLKIRWISQSSINFARDVELLTLAAKSGCVGMLIGFESIAEDVIKSIGKKVNKVTKYISDIKTIHKFGIGVIGCFVFGFDGEDESIFKKTLKFVKKVNIDVPQFTLLTPYPGTKIREQFEKAGRILHNYWEKYDVMHVTFQPANMSIEELQRNYQLVCKRVYSFWGIFIRAIKSIFYLRSFRKIFIFIQINIVYRKIFKTSLR